MKRTSPAARLESDYCKRWDLPRTCIGCGAPVTWRTDGRTQHRADCSIVQAVRATNARLAHLQRERTSTAARRAARQ